MQIPPENLKIPIFQGHGTADPVIPVFIGSSTHDVLESLGEWRRTGRPVVCASPVVLLKGMHDSCTMSRALLWVLFLVAFTVPRLSEGVG